MRLVKVLAAALMLAALSAPALAGTARVEWVRLPSANTPGGEITTGSAESDSTSTGSAVTTSAAPTFPADGGLNANSGKARISAVSGAVIVATAGTASATNGLRIEQGYSAEVPVIAGQTLSLLQVAAGSGAPQQSTPASNGYAATWTFNRTADTNAYAANDVLGPATGSTAAIDLSALCPAAGGEILITSSKLSIALTAVPAGMTSFGMALYNITPPSALGDNAAWDEPSGDRASYLGTISLGTPVDVGSTLEVSTDGINKQITCPGTGKLFGYPITNGAYTPASATPYSGVLHATGL